MRIGGQSEQIGERVPTGVQVVVLTAVFDCGLQRGFEDKIQHKVVLWFESQHRDSKGRQFELPATVTASSHEKSTMATIYGALRGQSPTEAECAEGFDMDPLIGKCCYVNVAPARKEGGFPYIATYMPMPKGMTGIKPMKAWNGEEQPKFVEKMLAKQVSPQEAAQARPSRPAGAPSQKNPVPSDFDPLESPPF